MQTTEERRLEFVELVQSMRTAQEEFVKSQHPRVLENARYFERQVDRELIRLRFKGANPDA